MCTLCKCRHIQIISITNVACVAGWSIYVSQITAASFYRMPPKKKQKKETWAYSEAKSIMAQDMMDGIVPVNETIKNPERLCEELCANRPEFKEFPYNKNVPARIKTLQSTVLKVGDAAKTDSDALIHDRALNPQSAHGYNGRILWKDSDADAQLKTAMAKGDHLTMAAEELYKSDPSHSAFSQTRFAKRIDQLKHDAKPYGMTPGQIRCSKLPAGNKEKSRKGIIGAYKNEE